MSFLLALYLLNAVLCGLQGNLPAAIGWLMAAIQLVALESEIEARRK